MRASIVALAPLSLAIAATAFATPPDGVERGLVDGANHRVGDAGFIAREGREPTIADSERLRMHDHLVYIRELLASRPATRPALAARRTQLLGYLDDYIAAGTTPQNNALPWRTPVFVDRDGRICAVGYLIERSVGRDMAETIAKAHRYDYLEDIAAAMPEVDAWIAASGLTLDELASIQPGYMQPQVEDWIRWNVQALPPADGPYKDAVTIGEWRHRKMEGTWTRTANGKVVGTGTLHRGNGTWTSFYRNGSKLAQGKLVDNDPNGRWTFYHQSGNVAAEGRLSGGMRVGPWRFYYDTADKTPIAAGSFDGPGVAGRWKHYDERGRLLAVTVATATGSHGAQGFGDYLLSVVPAEDGLIHEAHTFGGPDGWRVDGLYLGNEHLYVTDGVYDADGNKLDKVDGTWWASPCKWTAKEKRVARAGDITTMHGHLPTRFDPDKSCGTGVPIADATRSARLDRMVGELETIRVKTPAFIHSLAREKYSSREPEPDATGDTQAATDTDAATTDKVDADDEITTRESADLPRLLAANMVWYVEWPHVDGRFVQVFRTIPGYWAGAPNGSKRDESERTPKDDGSDY